MSFGQIDGNAGDKRRATIIVVATSLLALVATVFMSLTPILIVDDNLYTITWQNYNASVLEIDKKVKEGTLPTYNGAMPIRDPDIYHVYVFSGWSPLVEPAMMNQIYVATYIAELVIS